MSLYHEVSAAEKQYYRQQCSGNIHKRLIFEPYESSLDVCCAIILVTLTEFRLFIVLTGKRLDYTVARYVLLRCGVK